MHEENPFRSPHPEPNFTNQLPFAPRVMFWTTAILSVLLGIGIISGIVGVVVAAILGEEVRFFAFLAGITLAYAIGSWWCGRLAHRIYRNELRQ